MTPERYQRICQLFDEALEFAPEQRAAFLAEACGEDVVLRAEVEKFLAGMEPAEDYLARPAMDVAAEMLAQQQQNPSVLGQQISHYQIIALLGAGGMGRVFLARDTRLGRQVALKLLPPQYTQDAERVQRFQTEAKAASALNHPNILTIHDVGEAGGKQFIATEYVEGQTLRQLLQHGPVPAAQVIEIALQLADALSAAHNAGIVHRDIKPENVMLRPDGYVKVLDFGLAKLTETSIPHSAFRTPHSTEPGKVMGTISYMSPEQALGQPLDARTDIFSLGVVLYELLTGVQPFRGTSEAETYNAILNVTPPALNLTVPNLPPEFVTIIERTLEKDRDLRFQTAADLKAMLLALKRNSGSGPKATLPVSAAAPVASVRKKLWQPKVLVVAVAALLLLAAGLWWWRDKTASNSAAPRPVVSFTRMTTQAGQELYPSLSPDGKQMIYAGNEAGNMDIWLQRVGGKTVLNLTRDSVADDTEPAFSPDGEQIVFRSEREGGGLFLMGATGESVRRLTNDGHNPAWSPDGRRILCSRVGIAPFWFDPALP